MASPERTLAWRVCVPLAAIALVLLVAGPLLRYRAAVRRRTNPDESALLPTLFDVNTEANVPTWFSASLWVLTAVVAVGLAALSAGRPAWHRRSWFGLAAVAALLSLDEAASLHERILGDLGDRMVGDAGGVLHFAWVLPGLAVAAVLAALFARAIWSLPGRPRRLALAGGGVFAAGALVAESLTGAALERYGDARAYVLLTTVEEGCEMTGVLLFLAGLLTAVRLSRSGHTVHVELADDRAAPAR